jgi:competence protein ComEC
MQSNYSQWRAAHPLVFIATLLLIGVILAKQYVQISGAQSFVFTISILISSTGFLLLLTIFKIQQSIIGVFTYLSIISWGFAIQIASQNQALVSIPYPTQIILSCRNWVIAKLNATIANKEANGFAQAIVLGVKSDMDQSLTNAYTQLGIVHIIAISGMHLEILFKNLKRVTQLLPRHVFFLTLELFFLLTCVWIYTLMAFASPSIVRASLFFSIFTIGKFLGASSYMLNTIAGGVLVILLFDIQHLNHIGLQLSYAAVIGIHLFYKLLFKSIELKNPIIQFLWSNCCMSLSAQLTTFPILALHFHQIAGWVLVSNFIMVPLSNYILYGLGILLILPIQIPFTFLWGRMVEAYIMFFNHFVSSWFLQTKAASIQISMSGFQIWMYYLILLFLYLWLYLKQPKWILAILGLFSMYFLQKLFS